MNMKMIGGLVGLLALLAFLAPPMIKLQNIALGVVVLIGAGMAVYEFIETLRSNDD